MPAISTTTTSFGPTITRNSPASKFGHHCKPLRTVPLRLTESRSRADAANACATVRESGDVAEHRALTPFAVDPDLLRHRDGLRIAAPLVLGEQGGEEWGVEVRPASGIIGVGQSGGSHGDAGNLRRLYCLA